MTILSSRDEFWKGMGIKLATKLCSIVHPVLANDYEDIRRSYGSKAKSEIERAYLVINLDR